MNANHKTLIGAATMVALSAISAEAQITYLDADTANQPGTTNTTFADGSAFMPPMTGATVPADNQWWERTGFANDSDILAVHGGSDAPVIRTTISGLAPNAQYDVYVYYWWADTFGNGEWDLGAGFTQAGITQFLYTDGSPITSLFANEPVLIQEGNRDMYEYYVGCTSASAAGTIDVYIDDHPGNDDRSWYDGVGTSPTNCGGGIGTNYCISTANSTGMASTISASGTSSVSANDLVLTADNLPSQPGIFIAGPTPAQTPFFNGFLCIDSLGLQRFNNTASPVGGTITEAVDIATAAQGGLNVSAGSSYYFQRWNRDPAAGGGFANFSDGIEIAFVP